MSRYQSSSYLTFVTLLICLLSTLSVTNAVNHATQSSLLEGPNLNDEERIHSKTFPVIEEGNTVNSSTSYLINGNAKQKKRSLKNALSDIMNIFRKCTIIISFSATPTRSPSSPPSMKPTVSSKPTTSSRPSFRPSVSMKPSVKPSASPTATPTARPTKKPKPPLSITIIIGKDGED